MYIEEAHPADAWALPVDAEVVPAVAQPRNVDERRELAKCFAAKFADNGVDPGPLVVDTFGADAAAPAYAAWPERLYIIVDDVIVYKGGPGPFGYLLPEVKTWLEAAFGPRPGPAA